MRYRFRHWITRASQIAVKPLLPAGLRLPFEYMLYILQPGHERELRFLPRICPRRGLAIDVGANIGYWSYRMANIFEHVHAFEINASLTEDLRAFQPAKITVHHVGLSSSVGTTQLHIPVVSGLPLTGWASLEANHFPGADSYIHQQVDIITLDSFNLKNVALIKIDVEGHEVDVLRGAYDTIAVNRPIVIVEVNPVNDSAVNEYFVRQDYEPSTLADLAGVPGTRWNKIYVPRTTSPTGVHP